MDVELEALIEKAGRQAVFDRANALGWTVAMAPPAWIWRQIASEVLAHRNTSRSAYEPQRGASLVDAAVGIFADLLGL